MNTMDVLMVRIYITESEHILNKIVDFLKKDAKIRGMSVFRAISGSGTSGEHHASLVDLMLDLPLTIEFFDTEQKVNQALAGLTQFVKAQHVVVWPAKVMV